VPAGTERANLCQPCQKASRIRGTLRVPSWRRYLQTFQIGLISAQALFAPRRMGKSEFLEQDLIPAAQKSGLLTAYLNLWDAREHPRGALISALARRAAFLR
jgi:hypothetical protein